MMNVLLLSPGYPADMPEFTRGLAEAGARVFGVGDSPIDGLPPMVRSSLTDYIPVRSLWDEDAVIASLRELWKFAERPQTNYGTSSSWIYESH